MSARVSRSALWQRRAAGLSPRLPRAEAIRNQIRRFGLRRFREGALEQRRDTSATEIDDDFMMLHALPALHRTEITHKTIMTVAHASQSAIPEHGGSMHLPPIPSNLDDERLKNGSAPCPVLMLAVLDLDSDVAQPLEVMQPLLVAR